MIFRFNSKDGRFRSEDFDAHLIDLKQLITEDILKKLPKGVVIDSITVAQTPNDQGVSINEFINKPLDSMNFRNGEMFFLKYNIDAEPQTVDITPKSKQLSVDDELDKLDGLIPRQRTSLCKHTEKGMCEYCSPLPPYDEKYQEENNIKHMSYHAYIKSLNDQMNRKDSPSSFIPPLEEPTYSKDPNCPNHPPNQICSKCQPSLITLQQQKFRMVDHVEISNPDIVNEFINAWRKSGLQRVGLMIGKYEKYDEVPLGIKARVELIYELPQTDDIDGVVLESDDTQSQLHDLVNELGLQIVGIIYTDLTDSGLNNQTVLCKRHKDSFFLSSLEVIFAARQQLLHPNLTKWSAQGKFSSKFITCVITGNMKGEIDIFPYQVSNSAERLVDADLISASTHPNCVFINKDEDVNGRRRFVPEIFYNKINEYGRQVKQNAKPWFPVEYLIVSLTHGFPKDATESILFPKVDNFPIENRSYLYELQNLDLVTQVLNINKFTGEYDLNEMLKNLISNFHLIFYLLFKIEILNDNARGIIIKILQSHFSNNDTLNLFYKLLEDESWNTMIAMIMAT